jgi:hypothetical protein
MSVRRVIAQLVALVLCLLAAGAAPGFAAAEPVGDCRPGADWPAALPAPAAEVVALVNSHRGKLGLAPLAGSPTLNGRGGLEGAAHVHLRLFRP